MSTTMVKDYEVGGTIAETNNFRIRRCTLPDGRVGLFKIAKTITDNSLLDREALILSEMKRVAAEYEAAYALTNPGDGQFLNYELCFPSLVESFICDVESGAEGRRVNILIFINSTEDLSVLVPAEQIISRDRVRIDLKTSVWIMGKLLKLLTFTQSMGISINWVDGHNILIERDRHYVVISDWTEAVLYDDGIPEHEAREEIARAAEVVLNLLEANFEERELPEDLETEELDNDLYGEALFELFDCKQSNAKEAHDDFYSLVLNLWPRQFHPYTSFPRKEDR